MINPVSLNKLAAEKNAGKAGKRLTDFGELLKQSIYKVDGLIKESQAMTQKFIVGEVDNLHQVMLSAEKADIALQLTLTIREKLLESYKEIMRMQI